jgi:RimJ/RimL family protein N-acetyltransferase
VLGCVRLSRVGDDTASAELTYVLHPSGWGRGLATAMSRSVIARAFRVPSCESIIAGADLANTRSIEVMKRLGMRFLREVVYPLGPGVEYRLSRSELASLPPGDSVPFV